MNSAFEERWSKQSFVRYGMKTTKILILIHFDISILFDELVRGDSLYSISFTIDLSRYGYMYEIQV